MMYIFNILIMSELILARYKDGYWYKAKYIKKYRTGNVYIKWCDGSKDDRLKSMRQIKKIPSKNSRYAGIEFILLNSLLLEGL